MALKPLKDLLVGAFIGMVSYLPGASGATIAVVFNVYERIISNIADIRGKFLKDLKFMIPICIGGLLGMILCAKILKVLIEDFEIPIMFMFAALIACQIPSIKKMGDDGEPVTKHNILAFIIGFAVMMVIMAAGLITGGSSGVTDADWLLMLVAGMVYALSALSPGISGSTLLLAIGLFELFTNAMASFDLKLLIPFGIGVIISALLFAKVIDYAMANHRKSTYSVILGLTFGSIVTVIVDAAVLMTKTNVDGILILQIVIGLAVGIAIGLALIKVAKMYSERAEVA